MEIKEKVKQILEQLEIVEPEVKILDEFGYRVVALVVSSSFEDMSDGDRQRIVWRKLLDHLTDREQEWVEFVFTKAPSELASSRTTPKTPVPELNS